MVHNNAVFNNYYPLKWSDLYQPEKFIDKRCVLLKNLSNSKIK